MNVVSQLLVSRLTALGRALNRADAGGSGDVQSLEHRRQQFHALAVRQSQLFVEDCQKSMQAVSSLGGPVNRLICSVFVFNM